MSEYGECGHCGRTWDKVRGHSTLIDGRTGMFPLCEDCWKAMTPQERLPYYFALYSSWVPDSIRYKSPLPFSREEMETAVLKEV